MHNTTPSSKRSLLHRRVVPTFIAAVALAASFVATASAESNLTIEQSSFDFGYAPQKSKLSHIFWLKSTGTDLLKIAKIVPG